MSPWCRSDSTKRRDRNWDGFNRSLQHLDSGGSDGQAGSLDEGVNNAVLGLPGDGEGQRRSAGNAVLVPDQVECNQPGTLAKLATVLSDDQESLGPRV